MRVLFQDINEVIHKKPNDPSGYNVRATIKFQAGDTDGACLDWSYAGQIGDLSAYEKIKKYCK